jgi:hypothetical protein
VTVRNFAQLFAGVRSSFNQGLLLCGGGCEIA